MQPTFLGIFVILAGFILLLTRRLEALLAFTFACTLMSGSAALSLPALGGSSIAPSIVGLIFLLLRILLPHSEPRTPLSVACKANLFLIVYAAYAVLTAIVMPRLFAGAMMVVPMRPTGLKHLFDVFPLVPTSQNITSAFYICGTATMAVCAFIAVRQPNGPTRFVKTAIVMTWVHAATGVLGVVVPKPIWGIILAIFRNGSYAQLDQSIGGYSRISGILPEASSYAGLGAILMIFMVELWMRDILPRRTGPAAAVMGLIIVFATSSTGYVAIAGYVVILTARLAINPRLLRFDQIVWVAGLAATALTCVAALFVFKPGLASDLATLLAHFTVDKGESDSGLQRAFWARQGLEAFRVSYGLGIGVGSFRSSSLVTAIWGSVGVIGAVTMVLHILRVLKPLRHSTFHSARDQVDAVGIAASWTVIAGLVSASVAAPGADPGMIFACMSAVAMGLRVFPIARRIHPVGRQGVIES